MLCMYTAPKTFRLSSIILLAGLCSCDPDEHGEQIEEQLEDVDGPEPTEQSGEIDANEPETAEASADPLRADFNGDGFADIAIGAPLDDIGGVTSGSVNILYGATNGLTVTGDQIFFRASTNQADQDDGFGRVVVAGNFNGDAYADLAIGVPSDDVGADASAGSVQIHHGSAAGLSVTANLILTQDTPDILDDAEPNDNFGSALAVGDFDDDGFEDLAIGVPGQMVDGKVEAGAVHVIFGSAMGLTALDDQVWSQFTPGVDGVPELGDRFGTALAAGDFDDDGHDDLAVGVPLEDTGSISDAGWVHLLYGTNSGLTGDGDEILHQEIAGIDGVGETDDEFGSALAVGDFDDDGFDDLAAGVPGEEVSGAERAGAVNVLYGSDSGITTSGDQYLHQNTSGVEGSSGNGDGFGTALTAGDFDDDGHDDLAIGVPFESVSNLSSAGVVNVLYGADSGLSTSGDQLWHQNSSNIESAAAASENFGIALSIGDFDNDGAADLAIGVQFDRVAAMIVGGAVNVIYGSDSGLASGGDQYWHQNIPDVEGIAKTGDRFGAAVR
jgi:hypothetical protein